MKWEVLDFETFNLDGRVVPYCISFSFYQKIVSFYWSKNSNLINLFLNYIIENSSPDKTSFTFFVHNLNFDGFIIIEYLSVSIIPYKVFCNSTNMYYLKFFYVDKEIIFRCSFKLCPLPLDKIADFYNFEKMNFPYNFVNINNLNYVGKIPDAIYWKKKILPNISSFSLKDYTILYCENDIKILQKFLLTFFSSLNKEELKIMSTSYSLPSYSFKLFFKKFNIKKINEKLNLSVDAYIRKSYFGGRCEVFGNILDNEHIKYFDFSGMYSQCMEEKFHLGNGKFSLNSSINDFGFHTIEYSCDNILFPILPSKNNDNKLMFSNFNSNIGTYWFEEIQLFEKFGGKVLRVLKSYVFETFDYCFNDYVNYCRNIRLKGKEWNKIGKLLINSFYGGMGLNDEFGKVFMTFSEEEFNEIKKIFTVNKFYKLNNCFVAILENDYKYKYFFKKSNEVVDESLRNVSYASAISSKARIKLYYSILEVLKDGGRILYCDTDSIYASYKKEDFRENFFDKKWINFYKDGVFCLPKTYAVVDYLDNVDFKIKGVSNYEMEFDNFKKGFYGSENLKFKNQFSLRRSDFSLEITNSFKNINMSLYDKRLFNNEKKFTTPFCFDNPLIYDK